MLRGPQRHSPAPPVPRPRAHHVHDARHPHHLQQPVVHAWLLESRVTFGAPQVGPRAPAAPRRRGTQVRGRPEGGRGGGAGARAPRVRAPGDVDEDEPLDAGQLHLLPPRLQPQGPVQAAGAVHLLQPSPHVHALVVEPGGGPTVTDKPPGSTRSPGQPHTHPCPAAPARELAGLFLSCLVEVQA